MKFKKYSFYLLFAALVAGGCKKELDQSNPQSINEENAFQTIEHVELGVNGAYGRYSTYINDIYKNALTSDEAKIGPGNAGSGLLTYRYQYGADNTTGGDVIAGYYGYYSLIDQVNRVLPWVDVVTGGTEERKRQLRGSLLGLRALGHFGLIQSFSGVYDPNALGVAVMTVSDNSAQPVRASMGEVMAQIEADLTEAKGLFPVTDASNFSDTVLNKVNIAAFQARIALYRRDYDAAVTYATEVIDSDVKQLESGVTYQGIWNDLNTGESLFRVRFLNSAAVGALFTSVGGAISLSPSNKLVNSYSPNDIRLETFIGTAASGDYYVKKHYESPRGGRMVDIKVSRISEMYLIRAEAYARKSSPNVSLGADDLNAVRSARIAGYVDETFTSAAALIDAVMQERFKELAFEGFRFYDLKRNNLPVERDPSDAAEEWRTLPANSHRFIYPIPLDALLANPNTEQNPGY